MRRKSAWKFEVMNELRKKCIHKLDEYNLVRLLCNPSAINESKSVSSSVYNIDFHFWRTTFLSLFLNRCFFSLSRIMALNAEDWYSVFSECIKMRTQAEELLKLFCTTFITLIQYESCYPMHIWLFFSRMTRGSIIIRLKHFGKFFRLLGLAWITVDRNILIFMRYNCL